MKLLFKQRFFSWLDSYDIYDENGDAVYTVEGKLSFGHCLHVLDRQGTHIGTVKERVLTFLPKFEMFVGDDYVGEVKKEFTLFKPRFQVTCKDWEVTGNLMGWDYQVVDGDGRLAAIVTKKIWNLTDTYEIDVADEADALYALMLVLAIDAAECSSGNG